uniref:Uncharacterized protein n=1 Tax=Rhizophora mucronata TaxID=61149 RepID=A0A2P2NGB7_RHIMU
MWLGLRNSMQCYKASYPLKSLRQLYKSQVRPDWQVAQSNMMEQQNSPNHMKGAELPHQHVTKLNLNYMRAKSDMGR